MSMKNDPWLKYIDADQKTFEKVHNTLRKMGASPSPSVFPYKHNYNAVFGYDGRGSPGGCSIHDPRVRKDARGIFYLPETEQQRTYRYERTRRRFEREVEYRRFRYEGPKKKNFFMKNLRNTFKWLKKPHPDAKRKRTPNGNWEWVIPNKPVSTKRVKQWLKDADKGEVFNHLTNGHKSFSTSKIIRPSKEDVDVVNWKKSK